MFTETVIGMDIVGVRKTILFHMAKKYENNLPNSLYLDHYGLTKMYGFSPTIWSEFLSIKGIDHKIQLEIAKIAETAARYALARLQSADVSAPDISAAKELLANSKLLKQKLNPKQQVVLTRIPAKEVDTDGKQTAETISR